MTQNEVLDYGGKILAIVGGSLGVLTFVRSLRRLGPVLKPEASETQLVVYVANRGNHPFSVKRIRCITYDSSREFVVYDAAWSGSMPLFVTPGGLVSVTTHDLRYHITQRVILETDIGKAYEAFVQQPSKLNLEWLQLLEGIVQKSMPVGSFIELDQPIVLTFPNGKGSESIRLDPFSVFSGRSEIWRLGKGRSPEGPLLKTAEKMTALAPKIFAYSPSSDNGEPVLSWHPDCLYAFSGRQDHGFVKARIHEFK